MTAITARKTIRIPIAALVAFLLALLLFATVGVGQAQAQAYKQEPFACASGLPTRVSDSGSGSYDNNGNLYIPCGSTATNAASIYKIDPQGVRTKVKDVAYDVSDVAPSPTGNFLYLARMNAPPVRLNLTADGTYSQDAAWKLGEYTVDPAVGWKIPEPEGAFIDTDNAGNIYIADGQWSDNGIHTVVKYAPAGGTALTRFGTRHTTWQLGYFYHGLNGLAVKGDGSKVYTVEGGNNRVQVWTRGGTTATSPYTATSSFGGTEANNPDREGYCKYDGWEGKFASPYDIALDATETNLFILNTSCHQVMKFSTGGVYGSSERVGADNVAGDNRPHGFAVAKNGEVYIAQSGVKLALDAPAAPTVSITSGPLTDQPDSDTTPTFGFTSDQAGTTFQCKFDTETYANCTSPHTRTTALSPGSHTFYVKGTNNNLSDEETRTWTVSTTPSTCDPLVNNGTGTLKMGDANANTMNGDATNENFCGMGGDDTISLAGGDDRVDGGSSSDTLSYAMATAGVAINLTNRDVFDPDLQDAGTGYDAPVVNMENVLGSNHGDTIYGDGNANVLTGGDGTSDGADTFYGMAGNDTLNTRDGVADAKIDCGDGTADKAIVDASEATKAVGCETVDSGVVDTTAPRVTSTAPAANATGVLPGANVTATFSEAMMASSINTTTVKLFRAGTTTAIGAVVSYDATTKKATLNPNANLLLGTKYKAVVSTGAKDLANNPLDQNSSLSGLQPKSWTFTISN